MEITNINQRPKEMSQSDIINLLEKEENPLSLGEICILLFGEELTEGNKKSVSNCLTHLLKYNEVGFIEIDRIIAMEKYKCKHQMRLWFVDGSC